MKRSTGFTLVELLVVIGIIAVLISVLLPSLSRARKSANQIVCASNMRQLGVAVVLYANENRGILVPAMMRWDDWQKLSWDDLLAKHLGTKFRNQMDMMGPYVGNQTGFAFTQPSRVLVCPESSVDLATTGFNLANEVNYQRVKSDIMRSYSMVSNEWGDGTGATVAFGTGEWFEYRAGSRDQAIPTPGAFWSKRTVVKLTSIKQASEQLVLVENFRGNVAGSDHGVSVNAPSQCFPNTSQPAHPGKQNNYLFVDGHVKGLGFNETVPAGDLPTRRPARGMWSRATDN